MDFAAQSGHKVDSTYTPDLSAPSVDSATVSADGAAIDIVFDKALVTGAAPAASAFTVTIDSAAVAVNPSGVAFGADAAAFTLTMSPAIAAGATVTLAYTKPAANPLTGAAAEVATFTDWTVFNRPAAPTALTLTPGDAQIAAEWTAPSADGGSAVTGYEVQWKTAAQSWAAAEAAGQSADVTSSSP